jgi:Carboxypeptidase regulatory-like domain/TonB dependent receptor-like, beta-barrel
MRRSSLAARVVLLIVSIVASATLVQAQYRGSIQGVVADPTGAVVSGATISLTDKETNRTLTATSNGEGIYNIGALPPSHYLMTIEKTGFKKKVLEDLPIIAEQANAVDVTLELGESTQTVTVNGDAAPLIDTETAQISGTIDSKNIQALPSFGRDILQLAQLAPGVFGDGAQASGGGTYSLPGSNIGGTGNNSGIFQTENGTQISANGGRQAQNNVTLDGVGITSVSWGGAAIVTPNEDSVKEVKVVANSYDAESGRFGGGQIEIISQNGTNQYHGSFFFKVDRPGLNAYQDWNGPAGDSVTPQRDQQRFNQFGGSVGGPIWKNKLFGFFSYETIRNHSTVTGQQWFETPQLLALAPAGSIAAQYAAYPGESPKYTSVVDQSCASIGLVQGSNCNAIPGQGLDIGSPLNPTLFPLGTQDPSFMNNLQPGLGGDGTGSSSNLDGIADIMDVNTIGPSDATNVQYNGRLDFNVTSKDLVAYNIYYVPVSTLSYNGFRSANLFHHDAINEAQTALWDHTFSPTLINEVRVNGAGWRWNELSDNPQIPLGLPQTAFIGAQNSGNQIGTVCPGCNALGGPAGSIFDQWTINFKDVATKVHHSHTIKFGGEVTRLKFVQDAPWSARPNWGFDNYWDFLNDAPVWETGTFNPLNGVPTDVRKDVRSTLLGFFVQDDWKVRPNLTVNLGMRWEYFGPISFLHDQLSAVVLGSGSDALTGLSMKLGGSLYNADKKDFGPNIGFAWSPSMFNSKLVLRGGFGIGYTGEEEAITLNGWPNVPFTDGGATLTGSNIVYAIPTDPHQFEPFPANTNTIETFGANNLPLTGAPVSITAFPRNYATPYTYHYSLEAQYELGHDWVATLGYQGSASHHLTLQENLNEIYGAQGLALNPIVNNVDYYGQIGNASSNAMLADLKHRFSHSFDLDVSYRWAKSMDDGSQPYSIPNFQWNPKTAWGPSDYNVTNALKIWGVYTPTIFHGSNGWLEKVAGGWSVSGIMNAHSGFPWTPFYYASTCDLIYQGGACQNGSTTQLLPAQYLGGAGTDYSNSRFLSAGGNFPNGGSAYFVAPTVTDCTATFPATCNNLPTAPGFGRNSLRGPGYFDVDATLSKSFGLPRLPVLGESAKLEIRANFYNLFNHLNLNNLDTTVTDPHFGEATGALGSRTIEMQARFNF